MVIVMYDELMKAKNEFDDKNFEKALEIINANEFDGELYRFAIVIKSACLSSLKRYDEELTAINEGIEKYPYDDFLWSRKVLSHYFNHDLDGAAKALEELERITDKDSKEALLNLAQKSELVGAYEKAVKYCDMALDIDENFVEAIQQKSLAATSLGDHDMMSDCADRLLEIRDNDLVSLMVPFILKLSSGRYKDCSRIINSADGLDLEYYELFKGSIYKQMICDLKIEIRSYELLDITIDESLNILFNYHYHGIDAGVVNGSQYFIKCTS